jgi:hypothetical protein
LQYIRFFWDSTVIMWKGSDAVWCLSDAWFTRLENAIFNVKIAFWVWFESLPKLLVNHSFWE